MALDSYVNTQINLLVLPGGNDVDPMRYNSAPEFHTQNPDIQMEWFDKVMLPRYIDNNTPIFGICRGFQTLNVALGGSLIQHMWQDYSGLRTDLVDELLPYQKTQGLLDQWGVNYKMPQNGFKVNSLHHQGFDIKMVGNGVIPLMWNKKCMNIEAFCMETKPVFAVQYHPEEIRDSFSHAVITRLIDLKTDRK